MLSLKHVSKVYETRQGVRRILDDVNFCIKREKISNLGAHGAGKSTLIRLISGAERPTSGLIHRGTRDLGPLALGELSSYLTGLDNLKFVCRIYGVTITACSLRRRFHRTGGCYFGSGTALITIRNVTRLAFALSMASIRCFLIDEAMVVGDVRSMSVPCRTLSKARIEPSTSDP